MPQASKTVKAQRRFLGPKSIAGWHHDAMIRALLRWDDQNMEGHNVFRITAKIYVPTRQSVLAAGMLHDAIAETFPEVAPYLKWHNMTAEGPLFYLERTLYHAQRGDLHEARKAAIWPDASLEQLVDELALRERLHDMIEQFRTDLRWLGFKW